MTGRPSPARAYLTSRTGSPPAAVPLSLTLVNPVREDRLAPPRASQLRVPPRAAEPPAHALRSPRRHRRCEPPSTLRASLPRRHRPSSFARNLPTSRPPRVAGTSALQDQPARSRGSVLTSKAGSFLVSAEVGGLYHPACLARCSECLRQGPLAPRALPRFVAVAGPSARLSPFAELRLSARPATLLPRIFSAG